MKFVFLLLILITQLARAQSKLIPFDTYEENKKDFLSKSFGRPTLSWYLKSDATLTTDLAFYKYNNTEILVISSGIHGIEGYVGSSVQRWVMDVLAPKQKLGRDVLLIHSLNPWGMRNKRRVNENNIDLNRNFATEPGLYQQKNDDYIKNDSFLNPTAKVDLGFFSRIVFFNKAIQQILAFSLEPLRKAILLGQYTHEKGLYFGGHESTELQRHFDDLLNNELSAYHKITWIDLHTGYGEKGRLHILANDSKSEAGKKLKVLFPKHKIDFGDEKNFYKTKGDIATYLELKSTKEQEIQPAVFEYGTLDSQKVLGSIESLRRMVLENQGFHNGYADVDSQKEANELFQEMFFPHDEVWKQSILRQTKDLLAPLLEISQ